MRNHRALAAIVSSVVILVLAGSTVLALTTFTRDVGGSVTAELHTPDGIEVYLDAGLTQVADNVAFGTVEVDMFGTVGGGEAVPVWVHNLSLSTVRLSVEDDFNEADVAFDGEGTLLNADQTLAGKLWLEFSSGAQGGFQLHHIIPRRRPVRGSDAYAH